MSHATSLETEQARLPYSTIAIFSAGVLAGAVIWLASPWLTGEREPWDADGPAYEVYLATVGLIAGAVRPRRSWICPLGVALGQVIGMLACTERIGPLAPLGLFFFVPLMSLVSLAGVVVSEQCLVPSLVGSWRAFAVTRRERAALTSVREGRDLKIVAFIL